MKGRGREKEKESAGMAFINALERDQSVILRGYKLKVKLKSHLFGKDGQSVLVAYSH
jgi:hypothetical protein